MNGFESMLNSQLVLLVYLGAGAAARKKGIIDDYAKKKFIDFVLTITLPCMIFNSFNKPLTPDVLRQTALAFIVSMAVALISLFTGNVIYRRYPESKRAVLQYATLVNNSGFLGLALVEGVLGADGLLLASIFVIPNRIMMWTAGLSLFTKPAPGESPWQRWKSILLNPAMIATYLGLVRRLFGIPVPSFLETSVAKIGAVTSPMSMMIIGTMLVGLEWKTLLEPAILNLSFVRLIGLPLVGFVLMKLLHVDPLLTVVALIMTGMPAGSTTPLLASKYGGDEVFASRAVVFTTILSLFTAPALLLLLG